MDLHRGWEQKRSATSAFGLWAFACKQTQATKTLHSLQVFFNFIPQLHLVRALVSLVWIVLFVCLLFHCSFTCCLNLQIRMNHLCVMSCPNMLHIKPCKVHCWSLWNCHFVSTAFVCQLRWWCECLGTINWYGAQYSLNLVAWLTRTDILYFWNCMSQVLQPLHRTFGRSAVYAYMLLQLCITHVSQQWKPMQTATTHAIKQIWPYVECHDYHLCKFDQTSRLTTSFAVNFC